MTTVMRAPLKMLTEGEMPSADDIRACFNAIMDGEISQIQIAAFLTALKMRGERVEDIAAAAAVMREKATVIDAPDSAMDIVGTGGDGIGTYNISTATAFVVAGAGVPVGTPREGWDRYGYDTRCASVVKVSDFAIRRVKPISLPICLGSDLACTRRAHGGHAAGTRQARGTR